MMLKYHWGIGKKDWFKIFPFAIVAINILIAVGSDFGSVRRRYGVGSTGRPLVAVF